MERDFRPAQKAHPAFAVSNVDLLFSILTGAGIGCVWDDVDIGVKRFYASDPWGNRIEFTEPSLMP